MLNTNDDSIVSKYNFISEKLTKYVGVCLYILCLFGTTMNILTFMRRTYKSRACSLYLLFASICDFIHLNFGSLSNILQYGFHYDWTITSVAYCQIKNYFVYVFTIISATFTIFASIDRYISSSRKVHCWIFSKQSIAIRCIIISILFWFIISIPIIFCSIRIHHSSRNEQMVCSINSKRMSCFFIQIVYSCILNGFIPPISMLVFGLLTCINYRELRRRCPSDSSRVKQINYQLTSMLVLQSIKSSFTSLPYSIFNTYALLTIELDRSPMYQAKENLIHQIVYLLFWSNYTSFFVYLYSSDIFRKHWLTHLKRIVCCLKLFKHQQSRYHIRSDRI